VFSYFVDLVAEKVKLSGLREGLLIALLSTILVIFLVDRKGRALQKWRIERVERFLCSKYQPRVSQLDVFLTFSFEIIS